MYGMFFLDIWFLGNQPKFCRIEGGMGGRTYRCGTVATLI